MLNACQHFTEGQVLRGCAAAVYKRLDFIHIRLSIRQAPGTGMGFYYFADDKNMAAEVQCVSNLAFQIDGALLYLGALPSGPSKISKPQGSPLSVSAPEPLPQ